MTFHLRLREILDNQGLSQIELARRMGITGQCVTRWVTGHAVPRGSNLHSLAAALKVDVSDLFARVGTPIGAEAVHKVEELLLLRMWRKMGPANRAAMLSVVDND